jgi:hypothetical protein
VYLGAEFYDRESVAHALLELKTKGFGPEELALFSDQPIELPNGVLDRRSRMSFAVVASALLFLLLIVWFVYYTQYDYPLITGGMPLFSAWSTGVVFYEIMMFGAIFTTLIWFLVESGLLRKRRAPAPVIEPGAISLRVRCQSSQAEDVGQTLKSAGAINIRTLGEAA